MPKLIIICIVYNVTTRVNAVPVNLGVSDRLSLRKIVTQRKFDFERDCKVQFGVYVQASDDALVTNTMQLCTHGCIALGTLGNWQSLPLCFILKTAKVVTRRIVNELPMPDRVVKRVNTLGK